MYGSQWGSLAVMHSLQKAEFFTTSRENLCRRGSLLCCCSVTVELLSLTELYWIEVSENPYQLLQVTCTASECACNDTDGSYDESIIQAILEEYHLCCTLNTDGNKLW